MADEKVNGGPEEVSSAEPEVMEQAAVDTPPEAAAPEPEVAEPAEPAAGEPAMAEPEPEAPGGDMSPQVDGQEQPDAAESVAEDAPAQASLFGEEAPAAEQPEPSVPGEDGEVVVSFEQISELISKRNQEARAAIEQEEAAVSQPGDVDKGSDEPSQQEPAPKRRGRPPKEKQPEHEEKTDKPRRGRKPKEAVPDRDTPAGKPRDKVSRGKRGKAAQEQAAPGGGAAGDAPAAGKDTPGDTSTPLTADEVFCQKDATRAVKEEVVYEARGAFLERVRRQIFVSGMGVDPDPEVFGDSSGVALQYLYSLLELKAGMMETQFRPGFAELVRAICRVEGLAEPKTILQTWTRNMIRNDLETTQIATQSVGVISDKTILKNHPWVEDVEAEQKQLQKEKEQAAREQPQFQFPAAQNNQDGGEPDDGDGGE